ncbi:MAG: tRNA pseudouridine(38-40) synthase TruA [Clostridiales bacterium]|jgi:tRNA pseudouridine38-40 synthase|nr:tRNA pseudouridine(38-40) synthase TruA [Clostridiales bacterium]
MKNVLLRIQYDGTNYHGWQRQKNAITVQGRIENAVKEVTHKFSEVVGCSRTDAGVHGFDYVCNFLTDSRIPSNKFSKVLNVVLPEDISVIESFEVDLKFNSRFCVTKKTYSYRIWNSFMCNPFLRKYSLKIPKKMNILNMKTAASFFIGTHDFVSFMSSHGQQLTTERTIYDCFVVFERSKEIKNGLFKSETNCFEPYLIEIKICANSYLYNMVRIIVGTLIEVGRGKIAPELIKSILIAKNRDLAGPTAPPHGLFLEKVFVDFSKFSREKN